MAIHIWNMASPFNGKVNFIDHNNVLLGYDLISDCCERACWTISKSKDGSNPLYSGDELTEQTIVVDDYEFDPQFCEAAEDASCEEGGVAIFRLVGPRFSQDHPDLYVRLENHQNGYYSHGFVFRGDTTVKGML